MSAAVTAPPTVPPRPSRSQDKDSSHASVPRIPPRPGRRPARGASPEDRFAPSPLNGHLLPTKPTQPSSLYENMSVDQLADPIERPASVAMPSVGEEGLEYAAVMDELDDTPVSPEQTRTIADDLTLYAPKPSLPARSAKERVATVTRTDSERAASFGIGRPNSAEPASKAASIQKKRSSTSHPSISDHDIEEEQGIPEIGQRVPMNPHLGDVQAPSPAPTSVSADPLKVRHHGRKHSARGFTDLPADSYGLHSHGVVYSDKLDKAYYEKNPEVYAKEQNSVYNDRQNNFAMSSSQLNRIIQETASSGSGIGTSPAFRGTPSEDVGFEAQEVLAQRIASPGSSPKLVRSELATSAHHSTPGIAVSQADDDETIHVDEPQLKKIQSRTTEPEVAVIDEDEDQYTAPILAADEIGKVHTPFILPPAVEPSRDRRGSSFDSDEPPSRPTSRPTSMHMGSYSQEFAPTPLEDVEEYEPLFDEEEKEKSPTQEPSSKEPPTVARHKFPSKDVWEDAPNSLNYTAEVSTPDSPAEQQNPREKMQSRTETPAQLFAKQQEQLAEKQSWDSVDLVPKSEEKRASWALPTAPLVLTADGPSQQPPVRPSVQRFPSRDVWEDVPDSHLYETTVSGPQEPEEQPQAPSKPEVPARPVRDRPVVPERPKPKPAVSDKPKPQIPFRSPRVAAAPFESASEAAAKPKPAVPARPVGGKIAALQAGFMSDLNKRLQLGPHAIKRVEPAAEKATEEAAVVEKAPLSDARKGRARGPQRRAPAKSPAPAAIASTATTDSASVVPVLSFSMPVTVWSIDPEDVEGSIKDATIQSTKAEVEKVEEPEATEAKVPEIEEPEPPVEDEAKPEPAVEAEEPSSDAPAEKVVPTSSDEVVEPTPVEEGKPAATSEEVKTESA